MLYSAFLYEEYNGRHGTILHHVHIFFTMSQKSRDKIGKSRDFVKKVGKSRETQKSREK